MVTEVTLSIDVLVPVVTTSYFSLCLLDLRTTFLRILMKLGGILMEWVGWNFKRVRSLSYSDSVSVWKGWSNQGKWKEQEHPHSHWLLFLNTDSSLPRKLFVFYFSFTILLKSSVELPVTKKEEVP